MQALYFLGFFGVFYVTIATMTSVVAHSAIQTKLARVDETRVIFNDFEYAVNELFLEENADFNGIANLNDMLFVARYMSWPPNQLVNDPWGQPYTIISASRREVLYAEDMTPVGLADNRIEAPVYAFAVISPGTDNQLGNYAGVNTFNEIQTVSPAAGVGVDDIIRIFNTRDAMQETWNEARATIERLEISMIKDFNDKVQDYVNISSGYADFVADQVASGTWNLNSADLIAWAVDPLYYNARVNIAPYNNGTSASGLNETLIFPRFIVGGNVFQDLDLETEMIKSMPTLFRVELAVGGVADPSDQLVVTNAGGNGAIARVNFNFDSTPAVPSAVNTDWRIQYNLWVDGSTTFNN